ncbi:MAG: hypothetical protein Q4P15_06980 [Propionibacteriaceae bacterium]|nr:hypothetical protein [Propionibacteriaceae bacterium]
MKSRFPLRHLLVPALVAITSMSAVMTPAAQADTTANSDVRVATAVPPLESMRLTKSTGAKVTVTPEMQRNSLSVIDTIRSANWDGVSAAEKERLIVISLMTMAQESTFFTNPSTRVPNRDNDVGPFQQRSLVGWYADGATQAENNAILNGIPYATLTFIEGHPVGVKAPGAAGRLGYVIPGVFQKKNWRTDEMWKVAADVQVPASKYRYYYEHWRPVVEAMVKALEGVASPATEVTPPTAEVDPPTAETVNVYTTAGEHTVAGRNWRTTCEAYSGSIDRCRAEIWSTQVTKVNGNFVAQNGWNFNNLTYLPASRTQWAGHPFTIDGPFTSSGREWKTSCADDWTGPNACRSFIKSNVIESVLDAAGNRSYREVEDWVFNSVVTFSD